MGKDDKYTDPELRKQVKEEIHQSDKGGEPGQWSARKVCASFLAHATVAYDVWDFRTFTSLLQTLTVLEWIGMRFCS